MLNPMPIRIVATPYFVRIMIGICLAVLPVQVVAQPAGEPASNPAGAVELSDRPVEVPGLNLMVRLPVGSVFESTGIATESRLHVKSSDDPRKNAWLLQVYSSITRDLALTSSGVLDSIREQRQAAETAVNPRTRRKMAVRETDRQDNLVINGQHASRAYYSVPEDANSPLTGYTVFNPAPGTFVIFQFDCPAGNAARDRPIIETAIATAVFRDQHAQAQARREGIEAATRLLSSLSDAELEAALQDEPVFQRLVRPASGALDDAAAAEIGYQKLTLRKGQRGEVSKASKLAWTSEEREFGYLARVEARGLVYAPGAAVSTGSRGEQEKPLAVIDSVSTFWLSRDRSTEIGAVVNAVKRGKNADTYVQNIVRRGGRMTVQTIAPGAEPVTQEYDTLPDGYISRVELAMLPRLIAARGEPGRFNFYFFDFTASRLAMRRDEFERRDGADAWHWTCLPYEAQPDRKVEADMDARGDTLRREADGIVTVPTTIDALKRLWEGRKLPVDDK